MTSLSRRKRQTIVHACHTLAARTTKVLGLALFVLGGRACAQSPVPLAPVALGAEVRAEAQVIPTVSPTGQAPSLLPPIMPAAIPLPPPQFSQPARRTPSTGIYPVRYQQPTPRADNLPDESLAVTPPGFETIYKHLDSEANLQERIRQSKADHELNSEINFPPEPAPPAGAYQGRAWPRRATFAEPNYVIYDRLYFEDINSERYGWDLGYIAPFVSTGIALKDLLLFPMHAGTDPFRQHESNAGYCLPGDPVPYMIYPPEISLTGAMLEAASAATILVVFP